jgi:hypothetical protein
MFTSGLAASQNHLEKRNEKGEIGARKNMSNELTELEFSLNDVVGGQPLTPENVDLPTLRGFLEEVESLIKGDVSEASLANSRVQIKEGSVKIVALVAQLLASSVREDLAILEKTGDLDAIQSSRAKVIERWQSRVRRLPTRTYSIPNVAGRREIRISNTSQFQHAEENAWVRVEKHLTGEVVNIGGKQNPNVHLVLAGTGESVLVDATKQQLAAEEENLAYKNVTLRVQGEQHLRTKALRNLTLIQFSPQTMEVDEQALVSLWEKGREAWKEVKSAAGWVESLRGNK